MFWVDEKRRVGGRREWGRGECERETGGLFRMSWVAESWDETCDECELCRSWRVWLLSMQTSGIECERDGNVNVGDR